MRKLFKQSWRKALMGACLLIACFALLVDVLHQVVDVSHYPGFHYEYAILGFLVALILQSTLPTREGSLEQVNTQIVQLQENLQEDFFTKLVNINFKYIDKYYLQTQVQAD